MNRVSAAICLILVTIAAVEFGLIGASAAGITGGSGHDLPPVGERLGVIPTDTPTVPPNPSPTPMTPVINPSPPQLSPPSVASGITIIADPLVIQCDGSQTSHVRVRILDVNGNPAPDGINVYFEPYNGNAEPYFAHTVDGYAETDVRFYDEIFPYGPNLFVHADLLQAGIRILCFPQSDECIPTTPPSSPPCGPTPTPTPFSPPPCIPTTPPSSPPCVPPTPVSPPPCNPAIPTTPPCATPTPTTPPNGCPPSPPSVSPPCEPTPVSPPAPIDIVFDCDLNQPGEQAQCTAARGSTVDVGVVLRNRYGFPVSLAAFNFFAVNDSIARLLPPQLGDGNLNANPDFNQAAVTGAGWACTPPPPTPDWVPGGPDTSSLLSCFTGQVDGPTIPDGATIMLATVRYNVPSDAPVGPANLSFQDVAAFDNAFSEIGSCNPVVTTPLNCGTTSIDITAPATATALATRTATPVRTGTRPPRTATVVATRTPLPHRCADVTGNGRVNLADIHEIARAVFKHQYRAAYDINRDGRVSQADVIAAAKQFGRRC